MRIRILIICMLFCIASVCAKDIITKTDGTKIDAKVEEITESVIKYRKASNPTGPVYSIPVESVYNIVYENGEVENFNEPSAPVAPVQNQSNIPTDDDLIRMSENQVTAITSNDVSDAQLLEMSKGYTVLEKAKKYRKIGWLGGGLFLLSAGVVTGKILIENNSHDMGKWCGIIGAGGAVAGAAWCLGFNLKANSLIKEAEMQAYSATIIENEILHFRDKSVTAGINLMGNRMVNTQGLGLSISLNF